MMKWTVLSDNRSSDSRLSTEHGLSILLQIERHKILLDTGASDVFIRNAELLGVDLSNVDYVFISHGHSDHAGCAHSGLENILAACPCPVHTVVGGFYLLDGQETEEEVKSLAQRLKAKYPETLSYTSHCTGDNTYDVMKGVMGEQLQSFSCRYANLL